MIKSIKTLKPTQITIIKDGEVIADFNVSDITACGIDIDKVKTTTCEDLHNYKVRLEV